MNNLYKYFKAICLNTILLTAADCVHAQAISDNQIKKNIAPINSPLKSLLKLEPKVFEYDTNKYKHLRLNEGVHYGFLAENMQSVFPTMVSTRHISYLFGKSLYRDSKVYSIDANSLIPVLVASIKELHSEVEILRAEIQNLKKGVAQNQAY